MKIKNVKVTGLEESIVKSGYPMRSGEPLDLYKEDGSLKDEFKLANLKEGAIKRANNLGKVKTGTGHDNYLKGIIVQFDLQYPEYFTPQLQRYGYVHIVSSQSKMHKILSKELVQEDFAGNTPTEYIEFLNRNIEVKDFDKVINCLPLGYLKWMGISTNYLQLKTIYFQRKNHKLEEWKYFCNWIESLPMFKALVFKKVDL